MNIKLLKYIPILAILMLIFLFIPEAYGCFGPPPEVVQKYEEWWKGSPEVIAVADILLRILINYPLNILYFLVLFIIFTNKNMTWRKLGAKQAILFISFWGTVAAAVGAYFLIENYPNDVILWGIMWFIALFIIFLTYFPLIWKILRLNEKSSILIGVSMAIINLIIWILPFAGISIGVSFIDDFIMYVIAFLSLHFADKYYIYPDREKYR